MSQGGTLAYNFMKAFAPGMFSCEDCECLKFTKFLNCNAIHFTSGAG